MILQRWSKDQSDSKGSYPVQSCKHNVSKSNEHKTKSYTIKRVNEYLILYLFLGFVNNLFGTMTLSL